MHITNIEISKHKQTKNGLKIVDYIFIEYVSKSSVNHFLVYN